MPALELSTSVHLARRIPAQASNLAELAEMIISMSDNALYYHLFHRYWEGDDDCCRPNDFALWVLNSLGEDELGEKIAALEITCPVNLAVYRTQLHALCQGAIVQKGNLRARQSFFAMEVDTIPLPTGQRVEDPAALAKLLPTLDDKVIFLHLIEDFWYPKSGLTGFTGWLEALGQEAKAAAVKELARCPFAPEITRNTLSELLLRSNPNDR